MKSSLELFRNRHFGERAVLVANGPSLNGMDLSFLRNEIVIGLNKIYLGFRKFHFYPKYYVAVNKKVIEQSAHEIENLNCVRFISDRGLGLVKASPLTHFINTQSPNQRFCKDISAGVHEGWTVTYAAMQIAYYLGIKQLILIGMDHRYEYVGDPNESTVIEGDDPNHFATNYFGHGQRWDNPDLKKSEESYNIAKDVFESDGREIFDCTVDGACQIFKKKDYRKLFGLAS